MVGAQGWLGGPLVVGPGEIEEGPVEEAALLRAGRAGDDQALAQLLALHRRRLYALCHGILGHPDEVEDALQEAFLRALCALPSFRGDAAFGTWLCRIAINVCLEWKRSHHPTELWNEEQPRHPYPSATPETIALHRLRMMEALKALKPRQRAVFLLRQLEGWSVPEIAAALGWNRKRVENELYKARCVLADWRRREAADGPLPGEGEER
jgi:RNA polymerase sigma-70 factor, ECF subfamily